VDSELSSRHPLDQGLDRTPQKVAGIACLFPVLVQKPVKQYDVGSQMPHLTALGIVRAIRGGNQQTKHERSDCRDEPGPKPYVIPRIVRQIVVWQGLAQQRNGDRIHAIIQCPANNNADKGMGQSRSPKRSQLRVSRQQRSAMPTCMGIERFHVRLQVGRINRSMKVALCRQMPSKEHND